MPLYETKLRCPFGQNWEAVLAPSGASYLLATPKWSRELVLNRGIEPRTRGFSNHRSTTELKQHAPDFGLVGRPYYRTGRTGEGAEALHRVRRLPAY